MRNRIADIFNERDINIAAFGREIGISSATLYSIRNNKTMDNVGIGNFLAIAHGLGMSADELYTGKPFVPPTSIDRRYTALDRDGRALVDIALDAAEARQSEKEAEVLGA